MGYYEAVLIVVIFVVWWLVLEAWFKIKEIYDKKSCR